jgi:alpha-glucuronidase
MNKKYQMQKLLLLLVMWILVIPLSAEDGYDLWLRYKLVDDRERLQAYEELIKYAVFEVTSPELEAAKKELQSGIKGLIGKELIFQDELTHHGTIIAGTPDSNPFLSSSELRQKAKELGEEGYSIFSSVIEEKQCIIILAKKPIGVLYGTFHFLRLLQTHSSIDHLFIVEKPKIRNRILNHWDNLDRTVERGYAGFSIWDWHRLPDYISPRYIDYARACASTGINGTVLTNVNANALVLTPFYLEKVAALADVFRPYGIKVYLTARFSAPVELDGYASADPLDTAVIKWWKDKAGDIYQLIPDFGGFLVKANSEGQPGPQNFGRSHADGANMLASAVGGYGGIVMWRAFVYDDKIPDDRAKQAYNEFVPLDGQFNDNVFIQVKNGPIDFQPREPFHPLFGAMPNTPMAMEFQITQEYLGQGTQLVYLAPLFTECLNADTYIKGKGSLVSKVIDGSLFNHQSSCIAGVANIGTDRNWTGHQFGQANWYAFGRLAWNHELSPEQIAEEWIRMTFTNDPGFIKDVSKMMLASREIAVNYMTPLGLHHIMGRGHHYGPAPWINQGRPDWTSVYYHRADSAGMGFDRTSTGSNALEQYSEHINSFYSDLNTCPDEYLLWFHHLNWTYRMKSGKTLWEELFYTYYRGADSIGWMQKIWQSQKGKIDQERFDQVTSFLNIQANEAIWWRNACVLYFQSVSNLPIPEDLEPPEETLDYYMNLRFPYAPGIRPSW